MGKYLKNAVTIVLIQWCLVAALAAAPTPEPNENTTSTAPVVAGIRKSTLESIATADDLILLERAERSLPPIVGTPDEEFVARVTARLLPKQHYSRQPFDDKISSQFLDRYIQNLDNLRLHFLQPDLEEFEVYRDRLDDYTLDGNTAPARRIFERFLLRVEQRVAWVAQLLKSEKFTFDGDDTYRIDRKEVPWPKDLNEAQSLWRQHLRFEILQELLAQSESDQAKDEKADPAPAKPGVANANGLTPEIEKTITRRYARLLKTIKDFDGADVFQLYLTALTHVYDPHSDFLGRATLENFAINMNLSLFGIGAVLQSEDGYCKVKELRPGPAMRSKKIQPGDRIVAVAQGDNSEPVDVVDMKLSKIVELIRGPKDTEVRLTIIPAESSDPSARREVTLVRDEIRLEDEEAKAKLIDLPASDSRTNRIGIIDLPSFYANLNIGTPNGRSRAKSTTMDVARLLSRLKQEDVQGIILDLRMNGGGSLEEAIDLTGLFINEGPVVQVRDNRERVFVDVDPEEGVFYDGPLVVLTSRFSASASEILAGCLQDYKRAVIVGDTSTHGKGTVQSLIELRTVLGAVLDPTDSDPGAIKVTIRKFYRASGASTQLKGITPDIILPSVNNVADIGEAALDDPLPWDTIPAARFQPEDRVLSTALAKLRERSETRVANSQDFQYIREDIENYLTRKEEKTVSLNLEKRLQEKAEAAARIAARKEERKSRAATNETAYRIGLKEVDLPGLPPPIDPSVDEDHQAFSFERMTADPEDEEDKGPAIDPTMDEAKRILQDLIELSPNPVGLANSN